MAKHVANALEGYEMNTGVISSLDGLETTTEWTLEERTAIIRNTQTRRLVGPCWICRKEGHKAIYCVKKISRHPQQKHMRMLEGFSLKHLSDQQTREHEPRACRQEHASQLGKGNEYISINDGYSSLKARTHKAPALEDPLGRVKYGLYKKKPMREQIRV